MVDRSEKLAAQVSLENGKPRADARAEVLYAAEFLRWYRRGGSSPRRVGDESAKWQQTHHGFFHNRSGSRSRHSLELPSCQVTRKIGPALASRVVRSAQARSEQAIGPLGDANLLSEAGVAGGVVNVLPSRSSGPWLSAMVHDRASAS